MKTIALDISPTEVMSFRICRRRWAYEYYNGLVPKVRPGPYWLGTGIHYALEKYYTGKVGSLKQLLEAWQEYARESTSGQPTEERIALHRQAINMLISYYRWEQNNPQFSPENIREVEKKYTVPLLTPSGAPTRGTYRGIVDLVVEDRDGVWIVDHKTAASSFSKNGLLMDYQLTSYLYLYWRTTGVMPAGAIFNVIYKTGMENPRETKEGGLSKDKNQPTNLFLFLEAIKNKGLKTADYVEVLQVLGAKPVAERIKTTRTEAELKTFERELYYTYREMVECIKDLERAYTHPSTINCPSCPYFAIDKSRMEGVNTNFLETALYTKTDRAYERRFKDANPDTETR